MRRGWGCQTRPVLRRVVFLAATSALIVAACGGKGRTAESFCQKLSAAQATFTNGQTDAASVAKQFHGLGSSAPNAIHPSWDVLTKLFDDLAKVNVKDERAVQDGYQRALTATVQQASTEVTTYVKTTCGFDLAVPAITGTK
jgi:hypothetical protein